MKLDSGASKHYFRPCDTAALANIRAIHNGSSITLPDGKSLNIQQKGTLPLHPVIDSRAGDVNVVPHLKSASLLSVGQFTNFGCTAELYYNCAIIKKHIKQYPKDIETLLMVFGTFNCPKSSKLNKPQMSS